MANLLDQASIVLTPTAYDNGKVLCAKPSEPPYGDFDFSRNSAATRVNAQGLVENVQILSSNLVQNGDFSEEGVQEVSNGSFSQEGVQLITNGSFDTDSDWTKGTGWSISGGSANCDGTQISATNLIQSSLALGTNKIFKIEFELKDYQAGKLIYVNLTGTGTLDFENINANGTYVAYSGLSTGDNFITFRADADFTGSIDNVSVREVGQDWTLGGGWSIAEDKATSDGSGYSGISQLIPNLTGKILKLQFDIVDYTSGTIRISPSNKQSGSDIRYSNNGTYVEYYTSAQDRLDLQPQLFDGSITNISVKEVGQNWIIRNDWSIEAQGVRGVNAGATTDFYQLNVLPNIGMLYRFSFEILEITNGSVELDFNNAGTSQTYNTIGVHTGILNSTGGNGAITFRGVSAFSGLITNVSVIEITDDTNLPRINYEGFSYQDALGSELVTNGGFDTDLSGWSSITNVTWSSNFGGSAFMNAVGTNAQFRQTISYEVGKTYRISWEVKENNGCDFFRVYNNNSYTNITDNYIGTHYFDFTHTSGLNFILRNDRVGSDITIDNVSVKEYLGQEVVPDSGCGSWLWEPQRTNIVTNSELLNTYFTTKSSGAVITDNYGISPNGLQNSSRIQLASSDYCLKGLSLSTNSTSSVYVKGIIGETIQFGIGANVAQGGIFTFNGFWQRIEYTYQNGSGSIFFSNLQSGATATDFEAFGLQVEDNVTYATSYIPTSGSQVTRNQDLCTNGGSLATINSTEGTLYFEGAVLSDDGDLKLFEINNGGTTDRVFIYYVSGTIRAAVIVGGATQCFFNITENVTEFHKVAIKYKENDFALWIDGVEVATDTNGITSTANTLNNIDFSNSSNGIPFFGKTKCLAVFPYLSDQELTELTTI